MIEEQVNKKLKEMFEKLACEMISFVQQGGLQTGQSSGSAFSVDSRAMDAQLTGVYKKREVKRACGTLGILEGANKGNLRLALSARSYFAQLAIIQQLEKEEKIGDLSLILSDPKYQFINPVRCFPSCNKG